MVVKDNPLSLSFARSQNYVSSPIPLTVGSDQAEASARNFYDRLGLLLPPDFVVKTSQVYYTKNAGSYSQKVLDVGDANGIGVDLGIYLDGKQIFSDSSSSSLINVLIEGAGSVSYAQINLPFNFGLDNPHVSDVGSVTLKEVDREYGRRVRLRHKFFNSKFF